MNRKKFLYTGGILLAIGPILTVVSVLFLGGLAIHLLFNGNYTKGNLQSNESLIHLFQEKQSEFDRLLHISTDIVPYAVKSKLVLYNSYTELTFLLKGKDTAGYEFVNDFTEKNGFYMIEIKVNENNVISEIQIDTYKEYGQNGGFIKSYKYIQVEPNFKSTCKEISTADDIANVSSVKKDCSYLHYIPIDSNWYIQEYKYFDSSADPF